MVRPSENLGRKGAMAFIDGITEAARRLLGTTNEAVLRRLWPAVRLVGKLEAEMQNADDVALRQRSAALREQVGKGASLDSVQVDAFALVREVADRRLGMWNALDPARGFPDAAWEDQFAAIQAAREQLTAGAAPWTLDLPAAAYAKVRRRHADSLPPFRMRAHDVQVLGAMVLHQGRIAEMKTGEGKTLVASLTCFLNALSGKGVHVVTVNDYLAGRDANWNAPTLRFLGITIGAIQGQVPVPGGSPRQQTAEEKKQVYACDVVYGTNNEFGFDYLRDNLVQQLDDQVQKRRTFAIVDEVDSVLIDEARVPLIIAGPAQRGKEVYEQADAVAKQLVKDVDFTVEIKERTITITDDGIDKAGKLFGVPNLYDNESMHLPHFLDNALRANHLFHRDKEYLISDGKVKIVDEHTGRTLEGRRWSDGLHQAVEAKEGVAIEAENQTYATITLQNFFRLYGKLAGMTGTAMTEANEFNAIYKLEVVAIPPNRVVSRRDLQDLIYGSEKEKFNAIIDEVAELHAVGQPVLVGTISVDVSERLSEQFTRKGIPHNVLNARQHAKEASIVANAGQFGAVTIATNMAGRGTDIVLGRTSAAEAFKHWQAHELLPKRLKPDSPELEEAALDLWAKRYLAEAEAAKVKGRPPAEILAAINAHRVANGYHPLPMPGVFRDGVDVRQIGGLRIVGTERHESRRIDNQLRGRSGRQGDPGSTRFYLSLDDDLMKRFAGETMRKLMVSMGLKDGVPIESKMVSRAVEKAQKRVEEYHFGMRKNLLEYDQVANGQRLQIYRHRQQILEGKNLDKYLSDLYRQALDDLVQKAAVDGTRGKELAARMAEEFEKQVGLTIAPDAVPVRDGGDACCTALLNVVAPAIAKRKEAQGDAFPFVLRFVLLDSIDRRWKDHLYSMDHLRHSIGLEGFAQKDPKLRFKEEGYRLFDSMNELIRNEVTRMFFRLEVREQAPEPADGSPQAALAAGGFQPSGAVAAPSRPTPQPDLTAGASAGDHPARPKPGDPCPCGSGLAFRHCHGK